MAQEHDWQYDLEEYMKTAVCHYRFAECIGSMTGQRLMRYVKQCCKGNKTVYTNASL